MAFINNYLYVVIYMIIIFKNIFCCKSNYSIWDLYSRIFGT
jgi:hypothetical protein